MLCVFVSVAKFSLPLPRRLPTQEKNRKSLYIKILYFLENDLPNYIDHGSI